MQATFGTQTQTVSLDGTLSPRKQSDVNFAVLGTITKVYVKAGDTVSKGQKLARVDETDPGIRRRRQRQPDHGQRQLRRGRRQRRQQRGDRLGEGPGQFGQGGPDQRRTGPEQRRAALPHRRNGGRGQRRRGRQCHRQRIVVVVEIQRGSGGSSSSGSGSSSTTSTTSTAQFSVISTATWKLEGTVGSADLGSLKAGQSVEVDAVRCHRGDQGDGRPVGIVATSSATGRRRSPW